MISSRNSLLVFRILSDIVLILSSYYLVSSIIYTGEIRNGGYLLLFFLIPVWYFAGKSTGLYDDVHIRSLSSELILLIKNIFIQFTAAILFLFLSGEFIFTRVFIFMYAILLFLLLAPEKVLIRRILIQLRKKGRNLRNVLIVGAGEAGIGFYNVIKNNPQFGYSLVGFLDDQKNPSLNGEYIGKLNDLKSILLSKQIDNVIIALPNSDSEKMKEVIRTCEIFSKRIKMIPDYFRIFTRNKNVSIVEKFPVISLREEKINELHWKILKRIFDIALSFLFFILISWWLFPLIALLIKLDSAGPVIYKQERWGKDNKNFYAYKFRSMIYQNNDLDINGNYIQAVKGDPRVTTFGKFLRKTSLDELPQFWNVLKGDMTLVGPRPHPTPLNIESINKVELYMLRHLVKPGITGWAQVNGFRGETKDGAFSMQERIDHDLWYIENWSFWLDAEIIFLTAWRVLKGDPNAY